MKVYQQKIDDVYSAYSAKYDDFPTGIKDLENFPFTSFAELKDGLKRGEYFIVVNNICGNIPMFRVLAAKLDIVFLYAFMLIPYLAAIALLIISIMSGKYWLLFGLSFLFVASFFSSPFVNPPLYPFKGRRVLEISIIIGAILLNLGNSTFAIIPFTYTIFHLGFHWQRIYYKQLYFHRCIESEKNFCLLFWTKNIDIVESRR
jgi:hypothetical protein